MAQSLPHYLEPEHRPGGLTPSKCRLAKVGRRKITGTFTNHPKRKTGNSHGVQSCRHDGLNLLEYSSSLRGPDMSEFQRDAEIGAQSWARPRRTVPGSYTRSSDCHGSCAPRSLATGSIPPSGKPCDSSHARIASPIRPAH